MTYTLYADIILLNNFAMDFLLLWAVKKMMRLETRKGGIVTASLAGAVYALAVMLVPLPVFFLQTLATCVGMSTLMTFLAFRIRSVRQTVRAVAGLYMAAVLAAGIMEFFRSFGWFSVFWLYAAAALGSVWLLSVLWKTVFDGMTRGQKLYQVELFYGQKKLSVTAFLDTGNHLTEPVSGKPVSILSAEKGKDLFDTEKGIVLIPFRTVGRENGLIPAVRADRMEVHGDGLTQVIERPCIALSRAPLSRDNSYHMLLNEKFWM